LGNVLTVAFEQGCAAALARFKIAQGLPAARIVPKGSGVRGPVPAPTPMPHAQAVASPSLGERARAGASNAWSGASNVASRMMPSKATLGLAGLAGAGALAYGMHHQNQDDRDAHNLVYAPMEGTYG
jgi:hypothetical protein